MGRAGTARTAPARRAACIATEAGTAPGFGVRSRSAAGDVLIAGRHTDRHATANAEVFASGRHPEVDAASREADAYAPGHEATGFRPDRSQHGPQPVVRDQRLVNAILATELELPGYRVEGLLGRGGMGQVFEATQLALGRTVALKLLDPALSRDESFRRRFEREGRVQAALDHPHIVAVHEAGEVGGRMFIAMRLVRGSTLKELIDEGLDAERTLRILGPICDALDAAHDAGLTHRDIKPQNILVDVQGRPYLTDFGLTTQSAETRVTRPGDFVGTPHYVSPEQIRGDATPASDIYALGAVLFECLTGDVPFRRQSDWAVLYAHVSDAPPRASQIRPELSPAVDAVICRALSKDPAARFASARELFEAAAAALTGSQPVSVRLPDVPPSVAVPERPADQRGSTMLLSEPDVTEGYVEQAVAGGARRPASAQRALRILRRPAAALVGAAVFAVCGAGGGFAFDRQGSGPVPNPPSPAPPLVSFASTSDVSVRMPSSWRASDAAAIPGLKMRSGLTLGSMRNRALTVRAGTVQAATPTLLPKDLARRLERPAGRPSAVALGSLQALRYRDLRVRGLDNRLELFVAPTSRGALAIACTLPVSGGSAASDVCVRIAESTKLVRGRAQHLGASGAYGSALAEEIRRFDKDRLEARSLLAQAGKLSTQQRAARQLASAYGDAHVGLLRLHVRPVDRAAHLDVVVAVGRGARASRALAAATRRYDKASYRRAVASLRRSDAELQRSLSDLQRIGYKPALLRSSAGSHLSATLPRSVTALSPLVAP
jgi:serine/threonine protein kinase